MKKLVWLGSSPQPLPIGYNLGSHVYQKILQFFHVEIIFGSRFADLSLVYRYAASVGAKHFQTSAKQNKGVEELFLDLSKRRSIIVLLCRVFQR